ncbi:acetyltransferase [Pseudomonas sp. PDM12]|uniref:acetyltransferase n=1 Tax=Pseudomonas sp. PDM12 TaxID=2769260 RepID=UPI00177B6EE6|nr:acetyltransferase [Pseudomonas sp. PDM12]MBD9656064.1 acetyltransferase [Pseudomonas sp. PDM12]
MAEQIIIFGGGETALLAYEYFTHDSPYEVVAFSMDAEFIESDSLMGLPVLPITDVVKRFPPSEYSGFVAASSTKLNRVRKGLYDKVKSMSYELVSYVSSRAFVWPSVKVGDNCFIMEDNTLQPFTEIGNNVVMWSGNHLGHRSTVRDDCFISSHCVISGFCDIGKSSFLGVNCTIENDVCIGEDNFIGAGALIRKNTEKGAFYQIPQTEVAKISAYRLFKIKE